MNINQAKEYLKNDFLDINNRIQNSYGVMHNVMETFYASITNILLDSTADYCNHKVFHLPSHNIIFAFKQHDMISMHDFLHPVLMEGAYNRDFINNVIVCTDTDYNSFLSYNYTTSISYLDLVNYGASMIPASDEQKKKIHDLINKDKDEDDSNNKISHLTTSIDYLMKIMNDNQKFTL